MPHTMKFGQVSLLSFNEWNSLSPPFNFPKSQFPVLMTRMTGTMNNEFNVCGKQSKVDQKNCYIDVQSHFHNSNRKSQLFLDRQTDFAFFLAYNLSNCCSTSNLVTLEPWIAVSPGNSWRRERPVNAEIRC